MTNVRLAGMNGTRRRERTLEAILLEGGESGMERRRWRRISRYLVAPSLGSKKALRVVVETERGETLVDQIAVKGRGEATAIGMVKQPSSSRCRWRFAARRVGFWADGGVALLSLAVNAFSDVWYSEIRLMGRNAVWGIEEGVCETAEKKRPGGNWESGFGLPKQDRSG